MRQEPAGFNDWTAQGTAQGTATSALNASQNPAPGDKDVTGLHKLRSQACMSETALYAMCQAAGLLHASPALAAAHAASTTATVTQVTCGCMQQAAHSLELIRQREEAQQLNVAMVGLRCSLKAASVV
jgi:hypothetical protein